MKNQNTTSTVKASNPAAMIGRNVLSALAGLAARPKLRKSVAPGVKTDIDPQLDKARADWANRPLI